MLFRNSVESLLNEDRSPPGQGSGAEGDTGEGQRWDHEGLVLAQAYKVFL